MEPEVGPTSTADADQKDKNATREKGGENVESRRKSSSSSSSNKGVFGRKNDGEGIFVSIKSINISGSDPDLRRASSSTPTENNFLLRGSFTSDRDKISRQFNIPDIKSETTVFVPRVCSDSHIGEGEGFHSSRLSSSASHGSLSSALLVVGITSSGTNANASKKLTSIPSEGCDSESLVNSKKVGEKEKEEDEETDKTIGQDVEVFSGGESSDTNHNNPPEKVVVEDLDVFLESVSVGGCGEDVEEGDLLSIQGLHDISVANTEDFIDDEELLEEYDEPNDGLSREIEKAFESEELVGVERSESSGGRRRRRGVVVPCPISKYKDSATWTQEDDMPSPLSDLSPIQSPRKASSGGKQSSRGGNGGVGAGVGGGGGHQFDHQYQYHHPSQGYLRESRDRHSHQQTGGGSSSRNSRSHHRSSRGIHQSQSNQRTGVVSVAGGGSSVVGEFIHHQPQQHHQPTECFTVSSQLLSREARLYENVPTTPGELETLEILLGGEAGVGSSASNYPPSGGSAGASSTSKGSSSHTSNKTQSISSGKNNCGSVGGGRESSGSSGTSNHHHNQHHQQHHQHHHGLLLGHHHSANNLNLLVPSPTATANSVEQLFSVSELLGGPGSCLAVGGGGPPSRTSWVDSGRESLSFDGENNNSGGSTRNLLLIPPPPPPPINYQSGFVPISSSIIMQAQKHHHHHHHQQQQLLQQSPSHSQGSSRKTGRGGEGGSRRERLVRQKQAIDETFLPIPTNSDLKLGLEQGGNCGTGTGYLAVPSPRRGVIPGNIIASNFIAAAASPISLQRHPPPSQIMLQENKKNRALIPCESPYGIMSGGGLGLLGTGSGGTGDWTYSRSDKKGSQLTRDLLRCRSPQRGRSGRSKGHNQSFDYGELPSHQMFPKRHLLTSRQLSSHPQQGGPSYPQDSTVGTNNATSNGANGSNPNGSTNSPFLLHPNNHHRSFPAGLFSGMTPKSCSMGDLTSSTASPNNQASSNNHNYQSYHGNGKPTDQSGICSNTTPGGGMQSSTVPLVTSLPLPPATSVTYEFSLAPQSGTLAPGWHLTAVQRGLATAVPLAAAVARRRLPRPRTTRPRFGFTDKNEARRAKWTIAVTALALLAMSMLLVGITLRLAPLIDDLGSSSSSANLSPTKLCSVDPYSRRASGSSSIIRTTLSGTSTSTSRSREFLPPPPPQTTGSPNFDPTKVRRSHGDVDLRRQFSGVLGIPSRQDSCKSTSSNSEMERSNNIALLPRKPDMHLVGNNETRASNPQVYRLDLTRGPSSKSLVPGAGGSLSSARASRSNSVALSHISGANHQYCNQLRAANPGDLKKHKKYIIAGFACLLFVAVACVIISLSIAPLIDSQVRQQNQELIRGIQIKTSTLNTTNGYNNTTNYSSSSTLSPLISIDDQDETNNNQNSNNNNNPFSSGSQPTTRGVITIDPESEQPESPGKKLRPAILTDDEGGGKDVEKAKEKPLSSSLIGAVLKNRLLGFETFDTTSSSNINSFYIKPGESRESVESSRGGSGGSLFVDENEPKNSPTEFKSENSNILLGQISDIDEVEERVRTSIVLR